MRPTVASSSMRAPRGAALAFGTLLAGASAVAAAQALLPQATPAPATPAAGAKADAEGSGTIVYGDGWATVVAVPAGWEFDCCKLAKEHGVNLLVFPHGWAGDSPDRAMQLTVWTRARPSLAADWDADASAYRERFPGVATEPFAIAARGRTCRSAVYVADGDDAVRDYVVFCDPGNGLNFRYAWSMALHGEHADRAALETAFRYVVERTEPMQAKIEQGKP